MTNIDSSMLPTGDFLVNLSASLAYDFIKGVSSRLYDAGFGDDETRSLRAVYESSFRELLKLIRSASDDDTLHHLETVFRTFISDTRVSDILLKTALGEQEPNHQELRELFFKLGYDEQTLPVKLDLAIDVFIADLVMTVVQEAKSNNSPLSNRVTIGLLLGVARKTGGIRGAEEFSEIPQEEKERLIALYYKYIGSRYQKLEFTGLPVFNWEEKIVMFDDLYVEPEISPWSIEQVSNTESIGAVIDGHRAVVLMGEPGAGKSTLLQYIALNFASNRSKRKMRTKLDLLPIIVPLREYISKNYRKQNGVGFPFDYVYERLTESGFNIPIGFLELQATAGKCIFLFDGLDEVIEPAQRINIRDLIYNFRSALSGQTKVVVTARLADYEVAPFHKIDFDHFVISQFNRGQIKSFVNLWYEIREQSRIEATARTQEFLDMINTQKVERLASNPLYLTIMVLIHRNKKRLPSQRTRLFDYITEAIIMRDRYKGLADELDEEVKRSRLEHVAYWMQSRTDDGNTALSDVGTDDVRRRLAKFLMQRDGLSQSEAQIEAAVFIEWAIDRACLLKIADGGECQFRHRTFQEYFAAYDVYNRYLNAESPDFTVVRNVVKGKLHDPSWREVNIFLVSLLKPVPASRIISECLDNPSEFYEIYPRDHFMALRFVADNSEVSRDVRKRVLDEIWNRVFVEATGSESSWVGGLWREYYQETLALLPEIRGSAIEKEIVNRLIDVAKQASPRVKARAIHGLGQLGVVSDEIIDLLIQFLDHDQDPLVQDVSRRSLSRLAQDHPILVEMLETRAANHESLAVKTHCSRVLLQYRRNFPLTLSVSLEKANSYRDIKLLKEWSKQAIISASVDGIDEASLQSVEKMLISYLDDEPKTFQAEVAKIMGKLRLSSEATARALIKATQNPFPQVIAQAIWALGQCKMNNPAVQNALQEGLKHPNERIRAEARIALNKLEE